MGGKQWFFVKISTNLVPYFTRTFSIPNLSLEHSMNKDKICVQFKCIIWIRESKHYCCKRNPMKSFPSGETRLGYPMIVSGFCQMKD